jgi:hypothetical protein
MIKRKMCKVASLLCILIASILVPSAYSQDSALSLWDDLVSNREIDESGLLAAAQISKAELLIMRLYIDVCQEVQPEQEGSFDSLTMHLDMAGKAIFDFLGRYSEEELEALGASSNNAAMKNYEQQKVEMPAQFSTMEEQWQLEFCTEIRIAVKEMTPKRQATQF